MNLANLHDLYRWHRDLHVRYANLTLHHKTSGARSHKEAVARNYAKQAAFHERAAVLVKEAMDATKQL